MDTTAPLPPGRGRSEDEIVAAVEDAVRVAACSVPLSLQSVQVLAHKLHTLNRDEALIASVDGPDSAEGHNHSLG